MVDFMFDRVYSTLVLNNKQFEEDNCVGQMTDEDVHERDHSSLKKLYSLTRRQQTEPTYTRHLVLYFFSRLLTMGTNFMQQRPALLAKCLFGLVQVHVEYPSYFGVSDLTPLLTNNLLEAFEYDLIRQWLGIYMSDEEELAIKTRFPLKLFDCQDEDQFMEKYMHLVFEHCLNEFGKLPEKLAADPRFEITARSIRLRQTLLKTPSEVDFDYVKKNLFSILDSLLNYSEAHKLTLILISELKRTKVKLSIDSVNARFIYQLLFKLVKSIHSVRSYSTLFLKRFSHVKIFIETCLLGIDSGCCLLALTGGEHKLVVDYICRGVLINSLKLFMAQSFRHDELLIGQFLNQLFG